MHLDVAAYLLLDDDRAYLGLLDDGLDLGDERLVDKRADVEATNATNETKVEDVKLERAEIEVAEETEAAELRQESNLLQLEESVDVELVLDKQLLEATDVEVVEGSQLSESLEVEVVDGEQVLEVLVGEAEVVELADVEGSSLLGGGRSAGGSSSSDSGEGADEDGGDLHFDVGVESVWELKN